jgi:hypothetical protein
MTFRPRVKQVSPGRKLRWLGHLFVPGLFDGEHAFRIELSGAGGIRFRQSEQFSGILVPLLPSQIYATTRRGFEQMNRALKDRVEHM